MKEGKRAGGGGGEGGGRGKDKVEVVEKNTFPFSPSLSRSFSL